MSCSTTIYRDAILMYRMDHEGYLVHAAPNVKNLYLRWAADFDSAFDHIPGRYRCSCGSWIQPCPREAEMESWRAS